MEPVWVWEGASTRRQFNDVGDAALFLLYKWPKRDMTSKAHQAARMAALKCLEGKGTPEAFRKAFVKAAAGIDILATEPEPSGAKLPGHVARTWDAPWTSKLKRRRRG